MPRGKRLASQGVAEATAAAKGRKKVENEVLHVAEVHQVPQLAQVHGGTLAYANGPSQRSAVGTVVEETQQNGTGAEACVSAPPQGGTNFLQQLVAEVKEMRGQQMAMQAQIATLMTQQHSTPNAGFITNSDSQNTNVLPNVSGTQSNQLLECSTNTSSVSCPQNNCNQSINAGQMSSQPVILSPNLPQNPPNFGNTQTNSNMLSNSHSGQFGSNFQYLQSYKRKWYKTGMN